MHVYRCTHVAGATEQLPWKTRKRRKQLVLRMVNLAILGFLLSKAHSFFLNILAQNKTAMPVLSFKQRYKMASQIRLIIPPAISVLEIKRLVTLLKCRIWCRDNVICYTSWHLHLLYKFTLVLFVIFFLRKLTDCVVSRKSKRTKGNQQK